MKEKLLPHHATALMIASAISEVIIEARGYLSIEDARELRKFGFSPKQCRVPGLLIPLYTTMGDIALYVYRPDNPRVYEDKKRGKLPDGTYHCTVIKYEIPQGAGVRVDCPPTCRPMLGNPAIPLWITEGQKKADSLASRNLCAIAFLGVWSFKGRNEYGGVTILADLDHITWNSRDVRIVFDSDVMVKPPVRAALERITEHLQQRGAHVTAVYLPGGTGGKMGIDDWFAADHTVEELEQLVEAPRPAPKAAEPVVELLDNPPAIMRRPLSLIHTRAYAATWLYVRVKQSESENRKGEVIRHDPPLEKTEQRLFVVRGDGRIFGLGGDEPLNNLGFEVHLPEIPLAEKLWSTVGVKAYRNGYRPDPADTFQKLTTIVDRFIDFTQSLSDQQTMNEMIACYVLASWFLDAFNVIGFLWPNGDRGSGKTQLLVVIAELAYLGRVILAAGSSASLRDLADYGATIAFDDAENMADPRISDPDKRAFLLAGNRRGNSITVKEMMADRGWQTRYVNTFCPRLFSAIRLPDPVLASRTIIIPLIRTPDHFRANADPLEYELWPHDRRRLLDDLWALSLAHMPQLPRYEALVNRMTTLTGRNLEPWRAILAIAFWLEDNGVRGLRERMEQLALSYQAERPELESNDFTTLVIRALCQCANDANDANSVGRTVIEFTSAEVAERAIQIAADMEIDIDGDIGRLTKRVGHVLRTRRFKKPSRPGGKGPRLWCATMRDIESWAAAYSLPFNELETEPPPDIGTIGTIGTLAQS